METKPYCTTRSADCHKTFFNYTRPQSCAPKPQNSPKLESAGIDWVDARIAYLRSKRTPELQKLQDDWHAARKAGEARRGDMTPGRYQLPIVVA